MYDDTKGPITHFEWGSYTINGEVHSMEEGVGKDIVLSTFAEISAWSERKGHNLKKKMIARAIALKPDVLIIGNGVNGALKVGKKIFNAVDESEVKQLVVLPTPDACQEYNRLFQEGKNVVLLAHGTC